MAGIDFIQDLAVVLVLAGLVGWLCHRIRLSVVVGYLLAGMLVGPHTPVRFVTDENRIQTLAQFGLVFLMFSIGLRLSLRKLRRLGPSLVFATAIGSLIMFYFARLAGAAMGWGGTESLFLAGMVMVSSSAVVTKVLQETDAMHEKAGQLAMGVSVLEDVVGVIMLTMLGWLTQLDGGGSGSTLWLLGAFVAVAGVGALLLVPWFLRRLSISAGEELQTLLTAGLLLGMAILAQKAGYSLALGAYLLGAVVAETPHRSQVERTFEGMRDVFSAVFFVAVGMLIDLHELVGAWPYILGISVLTIVGRAFASATGMVAIGTHGREALQVGLSVTPIGEFSFIIAQLGVTAGVIPARFYPIAVGVSLITTLVAPILVRRTDSLSEALAERRPRWLQALELTYHRWLDRAQHRERSNRLWQLSKKRIVQVTVEVLLVTGLIAFPEQMFRVLERRLGENWLFPNGPQVLFGTLLVFLVLAPLVAIWRNISAMALLYAQVTAAGHPNEAVLRRTVETGIKTAAAIAMYLWLSSILPLGGSKRWLILALALVAVVGLTVLWRRLIYWHSNLEAELQGILSGANKRVTTADDRCLRPYEEWDMNVAECVLPDLADSSGCTLRELELRKRFGCTVVGVERQGFMVPHTSGDTILYPRDRLLLLGTPAEVAAGKRFLSRVSEENLVGSSFDELRMEAVRVPTRSSREGRTLAELGVTAKTGVQITGILRDGVRILNPGAGEVLASGDELLVMGSPEQISVFKDLLREM